MATDVQILGAAREVAATMKAVLDADQAKTAADREALAAAERCNEARKRHGEAERRLLTLSRAKPLEPRMGAEPRAEKAESVVVAPAPVTPPPAPLPAPAAGPVPTLTRRKG